MRGYFGLGQLSSDEKQDILNQHKSLYNGYQTMQPQVSNTQPLTVYDFAGDKEGLVVNNKGDVKKYTNMGINESKEQKEVCDECGSMIMDGVCECNYGHMEEETGHLDDIYNVRDLNLKKGDFDYVEGGGNDYGTFEKEHHMKNIQSEQDDDNDFMDYESSYTQDGVDDTDNEDDGFEDINTSEISDNELEEQGFTGGGNAPDMDLSNIEPGYDFESDGPDQFQKSFDDLEVEDSDEEVETPAFDFESDGPNSGYPVFEDDMYGYEPEKMYETMESAWADDEVEEGSNSPAYKGPEGYDDSCDCYPDEMDEQDVSGVQGVYGDMDPAYDFDSNGPGIAGPYQHSSWGGGSTHSPKKEEEFEEVDEDLKESFTNQRNKIMEMFNRFNKYN